MPKGIESESDPKSTRFRFLPWIIFIFCISIVLISYISVIFPALFLASDTLKIPGLVTITPDPLEFGVWSGAVVATNIIIFFLLLLYFKKGFPKSISNLLHKLFSFEISKRVSVITLTLLLVIYVGASFSELSTEEQYEDFKGIENRIQSWSVNDISRIEPHVKYFFTISSMTLFGNYKVIPFLASITLLVVTYLFTKEITKKRFAGIISVIVLMQSSIFLTYDTSSTYSNFWILFYLLSLLLLFKFWPLTPIFYVLSIFSKAITITFLPLSIFFIFKTSLPKKQKLITVGILTGMIFFGGIVALTDTSFIKEINETIYLEEFWTGFTSFSYQLRSDGLVLLFLIPLVVGLFIASKNGVKHGESIMILICGFLLIAPILTGFTNQTNQPYRFVSLIVFFAIGVGVLLSNRTDKSPN